MLDTSGNENASRNICLWLNNTVIWSCPDGKVTFLKELESEGAKVVPLFIKLETPCGAI